MSVNNHFAIEDLIQFDDKELSSVKILFHKYRVKWVVLFSLLFLTGSIFLFFVLVIPVSYLIKFICLIAAIAFLLLAIIYGNRKTLLLYRKYNIHYGFKIKDVWQSRSVVLREIRNMKMKHFLSGYPKVSMDKETVLFIIECLKYRNSLPRYKFQFLNVFSVFFSLIAGSFFAALITLSSPSLTWEGIIKLFNPIVAIALHVLLVTWFLEAMILKNIFEKSVNKYGRLISALEYYYMSMENSLILS